MYTMHAQHNKHKYKHANIVNIDIHIQTQSHKMHKCKHTHTLITNIYTHIHSQYHLKRIQKYLQTNTSFIINVYTKKHTNNIIVTFPITKH